MEAFEAVHAALEANAMLDSNSVERRKTEREIDDQSYLRYFQTEQRS
jgi:hypothetical protein